MSEGELRCGTDGGVATVVISNPAKRNAMTPRMWRALPGLLAELAADRAVRAVVLTGTGGTFCAGADISSLRAGSEGTQGLAEAAEEALAAFPKPTLAAVRGHCVGGGCQLAAACDLRFAAEDALFGVTPAKLGIVYPAGATRRLVRLLGPATAKYLLFSAELIDAARALRTGLVDEVLPAAGLDGRVAEFTGVLAARSQLTQAAAKEFADTAGVPGDGMPGDGVPGERDGDGGPPSGAGADAARIAHWARQARAAGDAAEGVAAFLERREPRFTWTV